MTRILLIGQDGQVGQELQKTLAPLGEVMSVGRSQLDLSAPEQIQRLIQQVTPRLIVNAAAYTAVDKAESEPALAHAVNAVAPEQMAKSAQALGAALIHISTDYVFDGSQSSPYLETDPTHPLGVYGESKLAGETAVQQVHAAYPDLQYAILRTAWVYGAGGKGNFAKTMLRVGAERPELRVVSDQIGTPTSASEIARAIAALAEQFLQPTRPENLSGLYHFTNSGAASWYDFAVAIIEEARALDWPLAVQQITPITTAEYPTPTRRPAYSVLSNQKIQTILQAPPPQWRQSLRQVIRELYSQKS
ncbi:MAG: dTDP-4-dehydrorhamnose reductase [Pegethrix bostrychoides GSE-TBD4-15B]|jgi:dTDP-4-dehydrorhamnose reductase|uniref:dTDP-4-dehydrorhamnose reductase n=1 Tax=Pegethrix bostrychoides GSE-TBD4-15B TaxID=2839662 RepID=A0A951U4N0_9CYAN|nr:dTDP-4-dehydrorhamnose reductase [Pegethrix bostrychoides GSE-TBD4-15B]